MASVYRFRVLFEDNEDIQRDIEILSNQSFADFHKAIQEAIQFDNKHAASFFVSDDYWRKNQEITLRKEDLDKDTLHMEKVKISSLIENPYQRFIYLYDIKVQWTLLVELVKITSEESGKIYPQCVKKYGTAPRQYKIVKPEPSPEEALLAGLTGGALLDELEDDADDTEAYSAASEEQLDIDEEEVSALEGEDGEEETSEEQEESGEDEYGFSEHQEEDY